MSLSIAAIVKAAAAVITDEDTRKKIGWAAAAVLAPVIVLVALFLSLFSGAAQQNKAMLDLVFYGGTIPSTLPAEYAAQVQTMRDSFLLLDEVVAAVNGVTEGGQLDGTMVKAVFYSLPLGGSGQALSREEAQAFVDCFVRYEERTRLVASGTHPVTGNTIYAEEPYTAAIPVSQETAFANLAAAGYPVTGDLSVIAQEVYDRVAYGAGGTYTGDVQYGGAPALELDVSQFADPDTKNAQDLVAYVLHAWQSGWGYVWGTYGQVLTPSLLDYKLRQYPEGVGQYASVIRARWLGGRTADCIGLIKGYGWLDPDTLTIGYGTNGMPDIGADAMYQAASVKGGMDTMPDTPGLAVWKSGHIGVYIGNGEVIEAMGTNYGVVRTDLTERNWTAWLEIPYIQYP